MKEEVPYPPVVPRSKEMEEALGRRIGGENLPVPRHGTDALQRIVLKSCSYKVEDRYASPTAMRRDLELLGEWTAETNFCEVPVSAWERVETELYAETVGVFTKKCLKKACRSGLYRHFLRGRANRRREKRREASCQRFWL